MKIPFENDYVWYACLNTAINQSEKLLFLSGFRYLLRIVTGKKGLQRFLREYDKQE